MGLATNVPVTYYFIGYDAQDDMSGYLDEASLLLGMENPPLVLTTSYGRTESSISFELTEYVLSTHHAAVHGCDARSTGNCAMCMLSWAHEARQSCTPLEIAAWDVPQATLRSSGPPSPLTAPCTSLLTAEGRPPSLIVLRSVTSVGGTQGYAPEEAWSGSSGGFSNYYRRPLHQTAAIATYLALHGHTNAGRFNVSGRGFPDIAAKADDFIILEPVVNPIYGTSASSPTVASIVALLNDHLLNKRRPPLGFLNPWLYTIGQFAFTDITKGNSSIQCDENDPPRGFSAEVGWDPVCLEFSLFRRDVAHSYDGIGNGPRYTSL